MKKKILIYVVENSKWIHYKRIKYIEKNQEIYKFKIINERLFYYLWKIGFYKKNKIIFSTWRIVHGYLKKNKIIFKDNDYQNFMACVTSHSNIGGGLHPLKATSGRNEFEAIKIAVNILKKFKIVTVNSSILNNLLAPYLNNILVCKNGVDINFFKNLNKYKYNKNFIKIGWIGKKRSAKNIQLLDQLEINLKNNTKIELVFIRIDKQFKIIPYNEKQILDFYNYIDYYLCVSTNEGTPNPALEAAACGVPVISTRVGNMPELLINNNGFLIEPNEKSVMKVINKLNDVDEYKYYEMSKNIVSEIKKNWSWKKRIKNFINAYNNLFN